MAASGRFIPLEEEQEAYAVGDIHGCLNTFIRLIERINYRGQCPLFLLGDYVNKGPHSRGTLEYLIGLTEKYPKVYPLLGNHDLYLINFLNRRDDEWLTSPQFSLMLKSGDFTELSKGESARFAGFLRSLPLYYETEQYLMVHAGFDFAARDIFADANAMLNIRQFRYDGEKAGRKKVIHGHLPVQLGTIVSALKGGSPVVPLDNGCVYYGERSGMGKLCCLELKQMRLITVENQDKKSP